MNGFIVRLLGYWWLLLRGSGTYTPEDDDKNNQDMKEPIKYMSCNAINHTALFSKPFCCCMNETHHEVWLLSSDSVMLVLLQCDMGLQLTWPRKQKQ
jgi:hypothetical protein